MSSKRPGGLNLGSIMNKKSKLDEQTAQPKSATNSDKLKNPFLAKPIQPEKTLQIYLTQVRNSARKYNPNKPPFSQPFCEVEARIGILKINNRRVTSSGPKRIQNSVVQAFDCTSLPQTPSMEAGVSRSHYVHWTQAGLSEVSPLSAALGVIPKPNMPNKDAVAMIKRDLVEKETVETVFAGYPGNRRVAFPGVVPVTGVHSADTIGQMEYKEKIVQMDWTVPAAKYDSRISLASEKLVDPAVTSVPQGWTFHRVKRRRSYSRRDGNIAWQIDVTEVTATPKNSPNKKTVTYEIEMELMADKLLQLINEESQQKIASLSKAYAQQLWWVLTQLNPLEDTIDVEELLQPHPNQQAVQLALAACGALKKFMENPPETQKPAMFDSPLSRPKETPSPALANLKFCGCMPVNFSRHNIDDIQRSAQNAYFLSEKTDGVRHFLIFTGDTAVLVDRAMKGKQVIPLKPGQEPMASVVPLIQPGTIFDGEVVMHRGGSGHKARPIFIVFDVLTVGPSTAVLHLPFEQRLHHLKQATFRSKTANRDMFADSALADMSIPLPLIRKNFVHRTDLAGLLGHVIEEKGTRSYRSLPVHNHLTDGIIFQPNLPYVCGTDVNLLKWKYLDTVTIDVEILPARYHQNDDDDALNVGVMGNDQTTVDMSRYVNLPNSERLRLEADKAASGSRIAEVGFDPETGEWYYLTMRPDKIAPNHISTVLGTLLELSESLNTEELQYRMSVPPGQRDTYRKDLKGMLKQLLEHQKRKHGQQKK
jgi:hypothetical protein